MLEGNNISSKVFGKKSRISGRIVNTQFWGWPNGSCNCEWCLQIPTFTIFPYQLNPRITFRFIDHWLMLLCIKDFFLISGTFNASFSFLLECSIWFVVCHASAWLICLGRSATLCLFVFKLNITSVSWFQGFNNVHTSWSNLRAY